MIRTAVGMAVSTGRGTRCTAERMVDTTRGTRAAALLFTRIGLIDIKINRMDLLPKVYISVLQETL